MGRLGSLVLLTLCFDKSQTGNCTVVKYLPTLALGIAFLQFTGKVRALICMSSERTSRQQALPACLCARRSA